VTSEENGKLNDIHVTLGELLANVRALTSAQGETRAEMRTLRSHVATLISEGQSHSLRLGEMDRRCQERHSHDTDEVEAARGIAARVEVIEREVADLVPRFDATETSVVRAAAGQEALDKIKSETARRWQIAAAIAAVIGSAAGAGIVQLLGG